jgi:fructose-bisphosphate aldolase class I
MSLIASTAVSLVASGRGVLAADESNATMSRRLEDAGVTPSPEARRDYRELLLTTPGLAQWVSGIILCDETLRQSLRDGTPVPEAARRLGIQVGIKVDTGTSPLALTDGELVTEGLDGLRRRLEDYRARGASFAKWRAVLSPASATDRGMTANAHALARYAALCQEAGVVPIVEPEVVMDGDHDQDRCGALTSAMLDRVFTAMFEAGVDPAGMVLKPNMVVSGSCGGERDTAESVAERTVEVMRACVAPEVPGIAFLSGGQSNEQACANLAAINRLAAVRGCPWRLTFSFGRALVSDALLAWGGMPANEAAAQATLAANCERASRASAGKSADRITHG